MSPSGEGSRRVTGVFLLVLAVAVLVRGINVLALPNTPEFLLAEDAAIYWGGAAVLVDHGTFGRVAESGILPETERLPGYIVLLAGLRWLFGDSLVAPLVVQAVLDSLTCVLIAMLGANLSRSLALVAGLLAAFWPNLVIHSGTILSDSLFLFFMVTMLVAAVRFLRTAALPALAWAGLSLGLALATRSVAQLLPFLMLPAAFAIPLLYRRGILAAMAASAIFLALSLLPVSPVVYRNLTEFGTMALSSQNGTHLAGWVVPLVRRAADGTPRDRGASELTVEITRRIEAEALLPPGANAFQTSAVYRDLALEALGDYPLSAIGEAWVTGAAINLATPAIAIDQRIRGLPHASFDATEGVGIVAQLRNFLSNSSSWYVIAMAAGMFFAVASSLLQLYGFVCLARIYPWAAFFAALCIGYFLVVNGPVGSPKYRLPFEPLLIVFMGIALLDRGRRIRAR